MALLKNTPWRESYNRYIFILISVLQAIAVIILEALLYGLLNSNPNVNSARVKLSASQGTTDDRNLEKAVKSVQVYMILFMFSQVFQVVFIIESIYFKNILQIFAILVFNVMTLIYSIFQFVQIQNSMAQFKTQFILIEAKLKLYVGLVAGFIGLGQLLLAFFAYKLYQEFGWYIYKVLGSDITMRKLLLHYYTYLMALKFSVFFAIGFLAQFMAFDFLNEPVELSFTIAAFPISLVIIYLSVIGARKENKWLLGIGLGGFVLAIIYFAYKLYRLWTRDKYENYKIFLTWFAALALLDLIGGLIFGSLCFSNFGKGLKKYISKTALKEDESKSSAPVDLEDE